MKYDLEGRTLDFSRAAIKVCKRLPSDRINSRLIDQAIRSICSIGANYREANETDTKKDFLNKIRIAKKECREAKYWLLLLKDANLNYSKETEELFEEANQLMKILATIYSKSV